MPWLMVMIPGTLVVLGAILALSALLEDRELSPRSMIVSAARSRRTSPDFAEVFVANQSEQLLRSSRTRQ